MTEDLKPGDLVELVGEPCFIVEGRIEKRCPDAADSIRNDFKISPREVCFSAGGNVAVDAGLGEIWLLHPSCLRRVDSALPAGDAKPEDWELGEQKVWTGENDGYVYIRLFDEGIEIEPEAIQFAKEIVKHLSAMIRRAEGGANA